MPTPNSHFHGADDPAPPPASHFSQSTGRLFCTLGLGATLLGTAHAGPETRDPWLWPFAAESIWNCPIGAEAEYRAAGLLPELNGVGAEIELHYRLRGPLIERPLSERPGGKELRPWPIPDDLVMADHVSSNIAAFLLPDGKKVAQLQPFLRPLTGGPVFGSPNPFWDGVDLRGDGRIGTYWNSGLSSFGGTLRLGELTGRQPLRHALKLSVRARDLFFSEDDPTPGHRWPATNADRYAGVAGHPNAYIGSEPLLKMGALLALPRQHTPESLGLKTAAGRLLYDALRDFGAYIVDGSANDSYLWCLEREAAGEFAEVHGYRFDQRSRMSGAPRDWFEDNRRLLHALAVVANNAPDRPGGGGVPVAPRAPEFGAFDDTAPAVPSGLSAEAAGPTAVQLRWQPVQDDGLLAGYDIFQREAVDETALRKVGQTFGRTHFTVTGLSPETGHRFAVRARDAAQNCSAHSAAVAAATPALPPGLLFADFDDDRSDGWQLEGARIHQRRLELENWQGEARAILRRAEAAAPYALAAQVEVRGEQAGNVGRVYFHYRDPANTCVLEFSGDGPEAVVTLRRITSGQARALAVTRGWTYGRFELSCAENGDITVRGFNGGPATLVFHRVADPSPPELHRGYVGFGSSFNIAYYDSLRVEGSGVRLRPSGAKTMADLSESTNR